MFCFTVSGFVILFATFTDAIRETNVTNSMATYVVDSQNNTLKVDVPVGRVSVKVNSGLKELINDKYEEARNEIKLLSENFLERLSVLNTKMAELLKDNKAGHDCPTSWQHWVPLKLAVFDDYGVPKGGVKAGTNGEGDDVYVARIYYEQALVPANYVPSKRGAYLPQNSGAHFFQDNVELLIDFDGQWVADRNGHVPDNAVVTGYGKTGVKMFTGRGIYDGYTLPGKIFTPHKVLYMPYKGKEVLVKEYEVLVSAP